MKYFSFVVSTSLFLSLTSVTHIWSQDSDKVKEFEFVDYVDPYIGNISHLLRPTQPVVHLPNSFMRINPVRNDYTDITLHGLSLCQSVDFHLSPFQGNEEDLQPVITYLYDNEEVTPYSYSVILSKQETEVRLGVSHQSAIYKIKFKDKGAAYLVFNSADGMLEWNGESISGYQELGEGVRAYIHLILDKIPDNNFVLGEDGLSVKSITNGKNACIVLKYTGKVNEINIRYGISFIDKEQARKNMMRELYQKSIDEIILSGRKIWNEALSRIRVEGNSEDDKKVFYTAMYRTYYRPVCLSEDGHFFNAIDGRVYPDNGIPFFVHDAAWDTFRAAHPLNALIDPEKESNILNSYLRMAEKDGNLVMPKFTGFTGSHAGMICNHIIVSFIDAYNKGIKGFSLEKAYEAGKNVIFTRTLAPVSDEPAGKYDEYYHKHGYVPALWEGEKEKYLPEVKPFTNRMSVGVTLGTAYDEWALAQMAQVLGKKDDFGYFYKSSLNYQNLFNSGTNFFHPRDERGRFIMPLDYDYSGSMHGRDFWDESNGYVYRFGIQYNIQKLIIMMGGNEAFSSNLDELFSLQFPLKRHEQIFREHNTTGIVGHYSMGNEPSFHIPYLYNYVGKPWKTQKYMRGLTRQWFRNDLMGIPGDEDGGAMSAYILFSFMGFYPVTPGLPVYNIGSPVFDHTTIQLSCGSNFEIIANNNSTQNKYIQSATLNGEELNKLWFTHSDVLKGGKLVLQMGPKPNKIWGSSSTAAPPSEFNINID